MGIQLCGTTPCMICGSEEIKSTICDHLGIQNGETTPDGMFTLLEVECLGACVNAPMIQVNAREAYEDLTEANVRTLVAEMKKGKLPPPGPMSGRRTCENSAGKTNLTGDRWGPAELEKQMAGRVALSETKAWSQEASASA